VVRERGVILRTDSEDNHNPIPDDLSNYRVVRCGDLVFNKMKAWQGSLGVSPYDGVVSPAYIVCRLSPTVSPRFVHYVLRSRPYSDVWRSLSYGVRVDQWDLRYEDIKQVSVLLPPRDEQDAIVRFLEEKERDIEHYLATKRRMIDVLEEQRQRRIDAVVLPVLTSEVHGAEALNTDELEGKLPPGWMLRPMHQVAKIQSGITLGTDYKGRPLVELPYLRVANVQAGGIDLSELKTISIPETEAQSSLLHAGDVLMTEGGDLDKLGRGTVWAGQVQPCLHQNHVFAVRPSHRVMSSEWLSVILATRYARQYFYLTGKKTTNLASTNRWQIGRFKVPIPPLDEQAQLLSTAAALVAPIDQGLALFRSEIAVMEEYRTRLIADAVTGQLDVRRLG